MILYHGSDIEIVHIELDRCRPHKDFGKGFYLTTIKEQAVLMARKVAARNGTTPVVNTFEFDEKSEDLAVKQFAGSSCEWAEFIYCNRFKPEYMHGFDIVIGPVADDAMRSQFYLIDRKLITFDSLAQSINFSSDTNQYCFCTEKAIKHLKRI